MLVDIATSDELKYIYLPNFSSGAHMSILAFKRHSPWWLKIAAKVIIKRLPISYRAWRSAGIFQHGEMQNRQYALRIFQNHYERARAYLPKPYSLLELGPGDSVATGLIAANYGSQQNYLVDVRADASMNIADYRPLMHELATDVGSYASVDTMLQATNTTYLTEGLASLRAIPSNCVDLSFSQAVLEHVRLAEFDATLRELFRIQRPGGITSHCVDLRDHLENSLNSLRFTATVWESWLCYSSGFYTNRLRASELVERFCAVGYELLDRRDIRWPQMPITPTKLRPEYRSMPSADLLTHTTYLVFRKPVV
jgi:ubiquinone/menaquinone biosynthesis C-methylase UbiE